MSILSERRRHIIVGIDGSPAALAAARWAAAEAAARRLALTLVRVQPDPTGRYPDREVGDAMRTALLAQGEKQLRDAAEAVRGADPEVEQIVGEIVPTFVRLSAGAAMIVLGERGLGGFTGMLIGSIANAVVAGATCPVAVVRTPRLGSPNTEGPVVVGVDGSPASEAAVAVAFEQASRRDHRLVAVHTWDDVFVNPGLHFRVSFDTDALEEQEREVLAQRLAGWQEKYPDVVVTNVVTKGQPVRALLEYGEDAVLIVVGSRGLGGYEGMLLGSTSQALVHHAQCPVVVVRPGPSS
jgi:nucleotide-binding universal stress UspA family protein